MHVSVYHWFSDINISQGDVPMHLTCGGNLIIILSEITAKSGGERILITEKHLAK